MARDKIKTAIKEGKLTVNYNGHVTNFSDDDYYSTMIKYDMNLLCRDGSCYLCGEKIGFELKDKVIDVISWQYNKNMKLDRNTGQFNNIINRNVCDMSNHKKQEGAFEITIPTGNFVIANFFLDHKDKNEFAFDVPKDEKYDQKYNICNINGQNNVAKYVAKTFNVAYGQMNTSLLVWRSNNEDKIFITEEIYDENASDKLFNKKFKSDKKIIGKIDQTVWRWEGADESVIKQHNAKPVTSKKISMQKGKYIVKNHYGKMYFSLNSQRYTILSEIEKISDIKIK